MPITENILQAITHTFLHSLWQGIPPAPLAGLVLLITTRSRASLRYNLLGAVLLLFLTGTGFTFWLEMQSSAPAPAVPPAAPAAVAGQVFAAAPQPDLLSRFMLFIDGHTSQIMMIWGLVFFLKCIRMGAGFYHIFRIRHSNTTEPPQEWARKLKQLALSLGIHSHVRLLESAKVQMPFTIGWLKPCIYVPAGLLAQLPADQLEAILLHELAHIRRRDYLVNILQRFTETIFFFNPALLWISACIREEREACCDDIAVAHTPHQASYLQALVAFEDAGQRQMELGMAFGQKKFYLLERVKRILTNENKKLTIMEKGILLLGLAGITAFGFVPASEQPAAAKELREIKLEIPKDTTVKPFKAEKAKKDSVMLRSKIKKANIDSIKVYRLKKKDSVRLLSLNFDTTAGKKIYKAYSKAYQQQDTQLAKKYYAMAINDTSRFKMAKEQLWQRDSAYRKTLYFRNKQQQRDSAFVYIYRNAAAKEKSTKLKTDSLLILKKKMFSKDSLIKLQELRIKALEKKLRLQEGKQPESTFTEETEPEVFNLVRAMQVEAKYGASEGIRVAKPVKLRPVFQKPASQTNVPVRKKSKDNIKEQPVKEKWHAPKHYKPTFREKAEQVLPSKLKEQLLPPVADC